MQRIDQDRRVTLALPKLNAWQEESLRLLGHGALQRLTITDPGKQYALDLAEFSQILNGGSAFALSDALYGTFTRLREAVGKLPGPTRKLYVAQTDAQHRVMRNETAVIEEMRRGYEIVIPGSLSFTQQVRLFRSSVWPVWCRRPRGRRSARWTSCKGSRVGRTAKRNPNHRLFRNWRGEGSGG